MVWFHSWSFWNMKPTSGPIRGIQYQLLNTGFLLPHVKTGRGSSALFWSLLIMLLHIIAPCFDEDVAYAATEWCFGNFRQLSWKYINMSDYLLTGLVFKEERLISYLFRSHIAFDLLADAFLGAWILLEAWTQKRIASGVSLSAWPPHCHQGSESVQSMITLRGYSLDSLDGSWYVMMGHDGSWMVMRCHESNILKLTKSNFDETNLSKNSVIVRGKPLDRAQTCASRADLPICWCDDWFVQCLKCPWQWASQLSQWQHTSSYLVIPRHL